MIPTPEDLRPIQEKLKEVSQKIKSVTHAAKAIDKKKNTPEEIAQIRTLNEERGRLIDEEKGPLLGDEGRWLIEELREKGFDIQGISDFVNGPNNYDDAIYILLKHLKIMYYTNVQREFIARALAIKASKVFWDEIVEMWKKEPEDVPGSNDPGDVKFALALILSATFTKDKLKDYLEFLDPSYGSSRIAFLDHLLRAKDPLVQKKLDELEKGSDNCATRIKEWRKQKAQREERKKKKTQA